MKEFNWDLSLIYNSDESIQKDMKKIDRKELVSTIPCILFYLFFLSLVQYQQAYHT